MKITKELYEKLFIMKINGVNLTYGVDQNKPTGYTLKKTTPQSMVDIFAIKNIPRNLWNSLYSYADIFNTSELESFTYIIKN